MHPYRWARTQALVPAVLALALAARVASAAPATVTLCHVDETVQPIVYAQLLLPAKPAQNHLDNHPLDTVGPCAQCSRCDDADPCTRDVCGEKGECLHEPVTCDDGDACTSDACAPEQGCVALPNEGASCDDGDVCTGSDVCDAGGQCAGTAVGGCCLSDAGCDDGDACSTDLCDEGTGSCSHEAVACPAPPACEVALCDADTGCATAPVSCGDDGDVCTIEQCDPDIGLSGACVTLPNPSPPQPDFEVTCEDGIDNDCDGSADAADPDCRCPCVDAGFPHWDGVWDPTRDAEVCQQFALAGNPSFPPQAQDNISYAVFDVLSPTTTIGGSGIGIAHDQNSPDDGLESDWSCGNVFGTWPPTNNYPGLLLRDAQVVACLDVLEAIAAADGVTCSPPTIPIP